MNKYRVPVKLIFTGTYDVIAEDEEVELIEEDIKENGWKKNCEKVITIYSFLTFIVYNVKHKVKEKWKGISLWVSKIIQILIKDTADLDR